MSERTLKIRAVRRAALLLLVWLGVLAARPFVVADGVFGAVIILLTYALPVAAPLILWLDWRWLVRQQEGAR